jgi:hypothetical protein
MTRPPRVDLRDDFAAVREVLYRDWNPLGAGGLPVDEYDDYVWPLVGLLRTGAGGDVLVERLRQLEVKWFGRNGDEAQLALVANKLLMLGIGAKGSGT